MTTTGSLDDIEKLDSLSVQKHNVMLNSATSKDNTDSSLVPVNLPTTVLLEGYLKKQARNFGRDWSRRYFVLTPQTLCYYYNPSEEIARCEIPLISASVKPFSIGEKNSSHSKRFRVLTPPREYLLEAESAKDAAEWITQIQAAIGTRILDTSSQQVPQSSSTLGMITGGRNLIERIVDVDPIGNGICADCNALGPSWVSTNLGVILCIECSGIHRSLGCQVSRVRSLEYDSFLPETIQVIESLGNNRMNKIWEVEDYDVKKSTAANSMIERKTYIVDKYVNRAFTGEVHTMSPITTPRGLATLFSPELEMFECVQTDDLAHTALMMFKHGVDINIRHAVCGRTPLHMAAISGQVLQAHLLLLNGANIHAKDQSGRTAPELALFTNHTWLAGHLAKYQRIFEKGNVKGNTNITSDGNVTDQSGLSSTMINNNNVEGHKLMMLRIREGFNQL